MVKKSDARRMLESSVISGLSKRAHLTGVTIDKAHILVEDILEQIFHNPSVNWAAREYVDELKIKGR